jgi:uncharacterized protein (TIGR02646 family)
MRPVDKGPSPGSFTDYREARDPLIERIGDYCSYCERILSDPEVEHQEPKSNPLYAHRALDWNNFLLSCPTCNRQKWDTDPRINPIYFPDEVNTAYIFCYDAASNQVRPRLDPVTHPDEHAMAERTIALMSLNRRLDSMGREDRRWTKRENVRSVAEEARTRHLVDGVLSQKDIESIRALALASGFFSVWLTVFVDESAVCNDLIAAFAGTRRACFDRVIGHPITDITL